MIRSPDPHQARLGIEAGLVAAIVSSAPGITWMITEHEPAWRAIQLIATLVGLDRLDHFDAAALLIGGALHVVISVAFAVAFALLVPLVDAARTIAAGVAFGIGIYLVDFELTQLLGVAGRIRAGTSDAVELAAHVLYGGSMATWLAWRRRATRRARAYAGS
jgi:hypothetical protein